MHFRKISQKITSQYLGAASQKHLQI